MMRQRRNKNSLPGPIAAASATDDDGSAEDSGVGNRRAAVLTTE